MIGWLFTAALLTAPDIAATPIVLDVNHATMVELEALPGIGAKKAQAIVAFREKRPFRRVSELMRVKGIGPRLYQRLKDRVRCDPPS